MKVLFCMAHPGHARNFEASLRAFAERGHEVVVNLDRSEKPDVPDVGALLDRMAVELPGLSVVSSPLRLKHEPAEVGVRARAALDYLRLTDPALGYSRRLSRRAGRQVPAVARKLTTTKVGRQAVVRAGMRRTFAALEEGVPVSARIERVLRDERPDVVLVTPLVEIGSPQTEYIRAARALGIPTVLPVASWDNLTMKGFIRELPNLVTVWNDAQRVEAIEIHGIPPDRVTVTGAVAYDHWFQWRPTDRAAFCAQAGLDPDRPYVMYACSSGFIASDEGSHLLEWVGRVRGYDEALERLQVLVRPHPTVALGTRDVQQQITRLEGATIHPPVGTDPTDAGSRQTYFDSMFHSVGVVGINTSAFIEAAIVGRPTLTVLTKRFQETQAGLKHFDHLRAANGGVVNVAESWDEHAEQMLAAMSRDGRAGRSAETFVRSFVRPHGLDVAASPRLVEAVEQLAAAPPPPALPERTTTGRAMTAGATGAIRVRLAADRIRKRARRPAAPIRLPVETASKTASSDAAPPGSVEVATLEEHVEWLAGQLAVLAERDTPIVFAPCLADLGFELLWWAPMVRWTLQRMPELADRAVAVTRSVDGDWLPDTLERVELRALGFELPPASGRERRGPDTFDGMLLQAIRSRLDVQLVDLVHPGLYESARRRLLRDGPASFAAALTATATAIKGPGVQHVALAADPGDHTVLAPRSSAAFAAGRLDDDLTVELVLALADQGPVVLADADAALVHRPELEGVAERLTSVAGYDAELTAVRSARAYVGAYDGRAVLAALHGVPTLAFADGLGSVDLNDYAVLTRLAELSAGVAPLHALSPSQLPAELVRDGGLDLGALGAAVPIPSG
ncbi:MAG: hypothetical protein WKF94_02870 [Solirubrobacteraceae bacterium]